MINFKKEIAKKISSVININISEIERYIEIPPDDTMGDYAFPCFRLAKELRKAPQIISEELKEKISLDDEILEEIKVVGGYLNFSINKESLVKTTIEELDNKKEEYGKSDIGKGKNVIID